VTAANHLCNAYGLDVISTGQVIATAMEWFEKGYLNLERTGGLDLTWGNGEAVVEAVKLIAYRQGIGDLLADGVKRAAEVLGSGAEYAALHVKGLEMAADEVRASKGEAVVHATSARGADHLRPYASAIDAFGYRDPELGIEGEIDYLEDGNKAWIKPFQELSMATNMLGVCLFASITLAIKASTWAELLSDVLGYEVTKDELLLAAERVINMERMVNVRFGFDRKDDVLPRRFLEEPAPDGRGQGQVVDLDKALDSYYTAMGWDLASGLPTPQKLESLGLGFLMQKAM
jgi:aldehyde:ferredoxin oxidoreductase